MRGRAPVHVAISEKEDFIAVSNYAGSLSLFPLDADGTIGKETFYQDFPAGSNIVEKDQATGTFIARYGFQNQTTLWQPI